MAWMGHKIKLLEVEETGNGRYKIYISHDISLMKELLHSILGLLLAIMFTLILGTQGIQNMKTSIDYNLINKGKFLQ